MKFVDYVKINVRSGDGGKGCCSFRREKFVPRGGPNGGDGGHGGAVYFQGDVNIATLLDFQHRRHHKAERGRAGLGKDKHGRNGERLIVKVPMGTLVRDPDTEEVLLEVLDDTPQQFIEGGKGGRGNARFKTSSNPAPMEYEEGLPGAELWVQLELKLIADVGLVGFPNAGKSTLISHVSRARPKIADYPFTTLVPNLGVVKAGDFDTFVMADIPGIIRGAHEGHGLGHRFLRHIERTAMLLLILDLSELAEQEPFEQYEALLEEMSLYEASLMDKPRAVALNKTDLFPDPELLNPLAERLEAAGERIWRISAAAGHGLPDLVRALGREVKRIRRPDPDSSRHSAGPMPRSSDLETAPSDGGSAPGDNGSRDRSTP